MIRITGLFIAKSKKSGETYLTGRCKANNQYIVYKNKKQEGNPMYTLYVRNDEHENTTTDEPVETIKKHGLF